MGRALLIVCALAAPASADNFKLFGEIHGGGMYGKGLAGGAQGEAFFANSPHGVYGVNLGAEFLFFDGWIQHHQYTNGSRITTWTQFGVGVHATVEGGTDKEQKAWKSSFFEFSGGLFFGVGTGQQVDPPLDNSEITDKAFTLEGRVGFGKHLNKIFDIGFAVPVSYGYFFKSGNGATANNTDTHYRAIQAEGLLVLRANVRFF